MRDVVSDAVSCLHNGVICPFLGAGSERNSPSGVIGFTPNSGKAAAAQMTAATGAALLIPDVMDIAMAHLKRQFTCVLT